MTIECPECRFDNPEGTLFCGKCGTKFDSPEKAEAVHTKTIETPHDELTTGSTFAGRYQIIEEVGKGGIVKEEEKRLKAVHGVEADLEHIGLKTIGVFESPVLGQRAILNISYT